MEVQTAETPAAFLSELGHALTSLEGVDADLANLVSKHILTASPHEDAVDQALSDITALARQRANSTDQKLT